MANGAFKFKDSYGNILSFISGSGSNISFSGGTLDLSGMTGLTLGNLTLSGTTQNAISASHAASYLLTSSFNTYSGNTNTVIGTLQTSTGSLNSFTSSATTRLNSIESTTGSLNSYTSSNNTRLGVIESTTGSFNSYTSSNTTNVNAIHTSTGSLNTFTSSATTRLNSIETSTGSLNSFTSSTNTRLNSIEGVSGSYATTGSNQFKNDQVITGSLTVTGFIDAQELRTTYISSSILYRSGSTKFGDELSDTHAFTGSLLVSGTISVPGSNLVSGSVQVDVMSTTNIARLATTGSNTFIGNQIVTGSFRVSGSIESSHDNLGAEGGQLILRGPVNRYNVDNWSGNALRIFREDDATSANGNVIIFASGSGRVGVNKNGANATLDVNGDTLVSGSITNRGEIIDGANNGNIAKLNFTRTDNSWGIHNETNLRIYVGSGNTTSPNTRVLELTTAGNMSLTGSLSTTGTINGISIPNDLFAQQFLLMGS